MKQFDLQGAILRELKRWSSPTWVPGAVVAHNIGRRPNIVSACMAHSLMLRRQIESRKGPGGGYRLRRQNRLTGR